MRGTPIAIDMHEEISTRTEREPPSSMRFADNSLSPFLLPAASWDRLSRQDSNSRIERPSHVSDTN
jgi:hypothetical protein